MSDQKNNPKKRNALGRGLSALLEDNDTMSSSSSSKNETLATDSIKASNFYEVPIECIVTNPFQPRTHFDKQALDELSESIKVQGIIQPITVRKLDQNNYQLISGERRFQASKLAGLTKIPAYIRLADDQQMLEMALIENIQRENLNSIEVALSYQRLLSECNLKQEELGDRVGKNRSTVTNYLRLLKLPPEIQIAIKEGKLSMGHARALVSVENIDMQLAIFKKVIAEDLSVRKTEELTKQQSTQQKTVETKTPTTLPAEFLQVQTKLSSHFGTRVIISKDQKDKGEIKIPYMSVEDLNRILEILNV